MRTLDGLGLEVRGRRCCRLFLVAAASAALWGCDPVSLTALGVGASAGVQYTLSGIAYRTFSEPLPQVMLAVFIALDRMAIKVDSKEKIYNGQRIWARTSDREIQIELEVISPKATRMRSIARSGVLLDQATSAEIIVQTEKALGRG